jgi:hypothetical protein
MTLNEIMIIYSENKMKPLKTLGNVPLVILVVTVTKASDAVNWRAECRWIVQMAWTFYKTFWNETGRCRIRVTRRTRRPFRKQWYCKVDREVCWESSPMHCLADVREWIVAYCKWLSLRLCCCIRTVDWNWKHSQYCSLGRNILILEMNGRFLWSTRSSSGYTGLF